MKKATFFLLSMCVFTISYAMQETKDIEQPKSDITVILRDDFLYREASQFFEKEHNESGLGVLHKEYFDDEWPKCMEKIRIVPLKGEDLVESESKTDKKKINKSKRRPKSIELGSYFLNRNRLKPKNMQVITPVDVIESNINTSYYLPEEWLDDMGKAAAEIFPLNVPPEERDQWLDAEYIARHEQILASICPGDDETEFWEVFTKERLEHMGKMADAILPLNTPIENMDKLFLPRDEQK